MWFGLEFRLAMVKANDWFRVRARGRVRVRGRVVIRALFRVSFRGKVSV